MQCTESDWCRMVRKLGCMVGESEFVYTLVQNRIAWRPALHRLRKNRVWFRTKSAIPKLRHTGNKNNNTLGFHLIGWFKVGCGDWRRAPSLKTKTDHGWRRWFCIPAFACQLRLASFLATPELTRPMTRTWWASRAPTTTTGSCEGEGLSSPSAAAD